METDNRQASDWEKFGFAYGAIMQNAIQALKARGDYETVLYSYIAQNPRNEFKHLFQKLQLETPENYDSITEKWRSIHVRLSYCR